MYPTYLIDILRCEYSSNAKEQMRSLFCFVVIVIACAFLEN